MSTIPYFAEVAIISPTIVRVILRDADIDRTNSVIPCAPEPSSQYASGETGWTNIYDEGSYWYAIQMGTKTSRRRLIPVTSSLFLDRSDVRDKTAWSFSSRTINTLRLRTDFHDSTNGAYGPFLNGPPISEGLRRFSQFVYYIDLFINSAVISGNTYTITPPASTGIGAITFAFNDRVTRFAGMANTQIGLSTKDQYRYGMLGIYAAGENIDYASITTFNVINAAGTKVYKDLPVTRYVPADGSWTGSGFYSQWCPDLSTEKVVNFVTAGGPGSNRINITAHGLSGGEYGYLAGAGLTNARETFGTNGVSAIGGVGPTVSIVDTDNITLDVTLAENATDGDWVGGAKFYTKKLVPFIGNDTRQCNLVDADGNPLYLPPNDYAIQIDGHGIGDWFRIDANQSYRVLDAYTGGLWNRMEGMEHNDEYGYTTGVAAQDNDITPIYNSCLLIGFHGGEIGGNYARSGTPQLPPRFGSEMMRRTRATGEAVQGFGDAGDVDQLADEHGIVMLNLANGVDIATKLAGLDIINAIPRKLPNAATVTGNTIYNGITGMSDVVQELAIWYNNYYEKLNSGMTIGGLGTWIGGSGNGGPLAVTGPFWDPPTPWGIKFKYAGTHASNFTIGSGFAAMSRIFRPVDSTLADLYLTAAKACWTRSSNMCDNQTDKDDYYLTELELVSQLTTFVADPQWASPFLGAVSSIDAGADTVTCGYTQGAMPPGIVTGGTALTNGGTGYAPGTYNGVAATGGTELLAPTFDVTVNGSGVVSAAVLVSGGLYSTVGDTLTISNTLLGGTGSGLVITVTAVGQSLGAGTTVPRIAVFKINNNANNGPVPDGLVANQDYWVRDLGSSTFAFYNNQSDATADTSRVAIGPSTSNGVGSWMGASLSAADYANMMGDIDEWCSDTGAQLRFMMNAAIFYATEPGDPDHATAKAYCDALASASLKGPGSGGTAGAIMYGLTPDRDSTKWAGFLVDQLGGSGGINGMVTDILNPVKPYPRNYEGRWWYTYMDCMYMLFMWASNGDITGGSITNAGAGYTDGSYSDVPLIGGHGIGARADIVVSGGVVSSVTVLNNDYTGKAGIGYKVGDELTASAGDIGGTGNGFEWFVSAVTAGGSYDDCVKALNAKIQFETGANPLMICNLAGYGVRPVRGCTYDDTTTNNGLPPPGTCSYVLSPFPQQLAGGGYNPPWAYLSTRDTFASENLQTAMAAHELFFEPPFLHLPAGNRHIDQAANIFTAEMRTIENILQGIYYCLFLHIRGNNTQTTDSDNVWRLRTTNN